MTALVFQRPWTISLQEQAPLKIERPNEVIVRIRATGICGTDVGIISGQYFAREGVIIGHESSGEVISCGQEVTQVNVGDRVVINPTFSCGRCRMCRTGRSNHCQEKETTEAGVSANGTFAKYYRTTSDMVFRLPDGVDFEEATLTEPLSCVLTGVDRLNTSQPFRAAIIGGGPMGLLYAWTLANRGINGVIIERSTLRLSRVQSALPKSWAAMASISEISSHFNSEQAPLDLVVDTTSTSLEAVLPLLARGGQVLLVGLKAGRAEIDPSTFADRSWSVCGSIDSLGSNFQTALEQLGSGAVPGKSLVSHCIPLANFGDGLALLGCDLREKSLGAPGDALKVVLTQ